MRVLDHTIFTRQIMLTHQLMSHLRDNTCGPQDTKLLFYYTSPHPT